MSWDIVLFNSRQKIKSIEAINEDQLLPTDFCNAFESHFIHIIKDKNHREIIGNDFSVDYFTEDEPVSNKMISLYGENALYELIFLAKKYGWQIYDSGIDQMIDLDNPSFNGYDNFQNYLSQILKQK